MQSPDVCSDTQRGNVFSDSEDEEEKQRDEASLAKKGTNSEAHSEKSKLANIIWW